MIVKCLDTSAPGACKHPDAAPKASGCAVAGFDAVFRFAPGDEALLRACLDAARRRARTLQLRQFRSRVYENYVCGIALDGNGYALDIYIERLRRDLPTVAEATPTGRSPTSRRHLALGIIDIISRSRLGMYDRYEDDWLPTLRARREPAYVLPHQLYCEVEWLSDRLAVTMDLLASWHFGEVAPPVLVEEMHTAAELLLTELLPKRAKRLSFAEMVEAALAAGQLARVDVGSLERYRQGKSYADQELESKGLLLSLKDVRKGVRHRGAGDAEAWLKENFWQTAAALEQLSSRVPTPKRR